MTQFGRMCAKLGIELIAASSPQAKGRIERIHGTHQDRLVKKLRRKQIASHEAANVYLERDYLVEHNRRFGRAAARPEDYHRRAPRAVELDRIFRLENERVVSEDGVVRYANRYFQLGSQHSAPAQSKVLVCEGRQGGIGIEYRGRALGWKEIAAPVKPQPMAERVGARVAVAVAKRKTVPAVDHPWRVAARREAQQKALRESMTRPPLAWPSASP
ncbi:MAG: hypothetical protein WA581_07355 [Candidatus Acidiferrales bacterium]